MRGASKHGPRSFEWDFGETQAFQATDSSWHLNEARGWLEVKPKLGEASL